MISADRRPTWVSFFQEFGKLSVTGHRIVVVGTSIVLGTFVSFSPAVAFVGVSASCFVLLSVVAPRETFIALLGARFAADFLGSNEKVGGSPPTVAVSSAAVVLLVVVVISSGRLTRQRLRWLSWLVVALIAWLAFRAGSQPIDVGLGEAFRWMSYGATGLTAMLLFPDPVTISRAVVAGGVFQASLALAQSFVGATLQSASGSLVFERVAGTFKHPGWLGYFLVLSFYVVPLARIRTPKYRLGAYLLIGTSTLITYSRGPLVLAVLVWLVLALLRHRMRILVSGLVAIAVVLSVPAVRDRFTSEFVDGQVTGSYESREQLRNEATAAWNEAPLLGHGTGYFFSVRSVRRFGAPIETHSDHLRLLVDTGLVGFGLYIALSIAVLKRLWSRRHEAPVAILFALVTASVLWSNVDTLHRLVTVQAFAWALVGTALAGGRQSAESTNDAVELRTPGGGPRGLEHRRRFHL